MKNCYQLLNNAAEHLFQMQLNTIEKGTYPVAGLLVDMKGNVIHQNVNNVFQKYDGSHEKCARNPLGHGEQNIMVWYWANKDRLSLPQPQGLTILTTLDPCMMCASSIVMSGFNVGSVSLDYYGGVNAQMNCFADFDFAPNYKKALLQQFGYYPVHDVQHRNEYKYKAQKVYFRQQCLSKQLERKIQQQFVDFLKNGKIHEGLVEFVPRQQLKNLSELPQQQEIVLSLKKAFPDALSIRLSERTNYYEPNLQLKSYLQALVKNTPLAKNAVALIDIFGNLLYASADRFEISPIQTAIACASFQYSQLFFAQTSKDHSNKTPLEEAKSYQFLPPIQYCTFVFLNALYGDEASSLQTVGVYAFTHNRVTPQGGFVFINDYEEESRVTLQDAIKHLPPLYKDGFYNVRPSLAKIGRRQK